MLHIANLFNDVIELLTNPFELCGVTFDWVNRDFKIIEFFMLFFMFVQLIDMILNIFD